MHCSSASPTTVYSDEILILQLCFLCGEGYMYICYRQNDWIQACLDLLHFIVLYSYCSFFCCCYCFVFLCIVFTKLKVFYPASSKFIVYWCHFPTAFAHSVSLCHTLIILTVFQTFSLSLYLLSSLVACTVKSLPAIWSSAPGLWRSSGEGNGNPLQYSCLENSMDRGVWWSIVPGIAKSQTWLSDFTSTFLWSVVSDVTTIIVLGHHKLPI